MLVSAPPLYLHAYTCTRQQVTELKSRDISWDNCLAFGTDNASVMAMGRKKSVFAFLLEKQPTAHLAGCPCHLIHHAAEMAASCLPFSLEDVLVDTYYYLDKSSKRQELYGIGHTKILKHVSTRWLSVGTCLPRILENWDALKVYFVGEKSTLGGKSQASNSAPATCSSYKQSKVTHLEAFYRSPTNKFFCLFLKSAIQPLETLNTLLQAEKPMIHTLHRLLHKLFRDLLIRFVAPSALIGKSLTEVSFDMNSNHKKDEDLITGEAARSFLDQREENHLRSSRIAEFYEVVKQFYIAACSYIKGKLPLNDDLLRQAEVADISLRREKTASDLMYFLKRFPAILPAGATIDGILLEFAEYQFEEFSADMLQDRADTTWAEVGKMTDTEGVCRFPNLTKVILAILSIPHSNASRERIFTCVRKNKTHQRASMGSDTLDALMVLKSQAGEITSRGYSDQQLQRVKSAYYKSLQNA